MNVQEVKNVLNVDLSVQNRKPINVVLRNIFINQEVEKGVKYECIAKELNSSRTAVYHSLTKTQLYKKNKEFKHIFEAYEKKDPKYLKLYEKQKKVKISQNYQKRILIIPKSENQTKIELTNLQIAEFLRLNNSNDPKLWWTSNKDYTAKQWEQIKNINPIMFDVMKI